jgi:hypothetical protein
VTRTSAWTGSSAAMISWGSVAIASRFRLTTGAVTSTTTPAEANARMPRSAAAKPPGSRVMASAAAPHATSCTRARRRPAAASLSARAWSTNAAFVSSTTWAPPAAARWTSSGRSRRRVGSPPVRMISRGPACRASSMRRWTADLAANSVRSEARRALQNPQFWLHVWLVTTRRLCIAPILPPPRRAQGTIDSALTSDYVARPLGEDRHGTPRS